MKKQKSCKNYYFFYKFILCLCKTIVSIYSIKISKYPAFLCSSQVLLFFLTGFAIMNLKYKNKRGFFVSIKKERIPAIEYMRGISMLGVVGIHVGSQYLVNNPTPNLQLLALFEIATRFSVPIFFFISAFGLFYNLDLKEKFNYKSFMDRRFKTVLIPYLVWSAFYILHYTVTNHTLYLFHPLNLLGILFFGLACYQLYFMILLVWFYALMPLWIFIVKRLNINLLVGLFIIQMAIDYYSSFIINPYGIENPIIKALIMYRLNYWVIHYIFIFLLGGYVAVHYEKFKIFMQENLMNLRVFGCLSLVGLLIYYYYCIYYNGYSAEGAINTAHQLSPAGLVYTLGATLYLFAEFQYGFLAKHLTKIFSLLGKHSYFMYLAHPVAITYLALVMAKFNIVMTAINSLIFYSLTIICTLIMAIICRNIGKNYYPKLNELTIGVYPKKK